MGAKISINLYKYVVNSQCGISFYLMFNVYQFTDDSQHILLGDSKYTNTLPNVINRILSKKFTRKERIKLMENPTKLEMDLIQHIFHTSNIEEWFDDWLPKNVKIVDEFYNTGFAERKTMVYIIRRVQSFELNENLKP